MKILLTGANGFIGSALLETLLQCGHHVVACGRHRANLPRSRCVTFQHADLNGVLAESDWMPLLNDVDAVINCAGILRESRSGEFDRVHFQAPLALRIFMRPVLWLMLLSVLGYTLAIGILAPAF